MQQNGYGYVVPPANGANYAGEPAQPPSIGSLGSAQTGTTVYTANTYEMNDTLGMGVEMPPTQKPGMPLNQGPYSDSPPGQPIGSATPSASISADTKIPNESAGNSTSVGLLPDDSQKHDSCCELFLASVLGFLSGVISGPLAFFLLTCQESLGIGGKRRIPFVWGVVVGFSGVVAAFLVILNQLVFKN